MTPEILSTAPVGPIVEERPAHGLLLLSLPITRYNIRKCICLPCEREARACTWVRQVHNPLDPYGHASTCCVLRGRRAAELLAGRRAARRHAARGQPAGARAREAARPAAPRPLGAARRPDRGGAPAVPGRAADARA